MSEMRDRPVERSIGVRTGDRPTVSLRQKEGG